MNRNIIKQNAGVITLEILIAFAILVINITTITLIVHAGQSIYIDTETNREAISLAEKQLVEDALAKSSSDFNSIVSRTGTEMSGPLSYTKTLSVFDLTPCLKQATSEVLWALSPTRPATVSISTFLSSVKEMLALGRDCPTRYPTASDWQKPETLNYSGQDLQTDGQGKALDTKENKTYLVTKEAGTGKDDFYIFDTSDINNPTLRGHLDISENLEDIDVANNFAFIANDEKVAADQLVTVDISDSDAPGTPVFTSLPRVSGNCPNTCPGGRSIFYYNKRVYIGTHRLVANGAAEFHVFDVTNPHAPRWLGKKGGTALGDAVDHNMNDIVARDQRVGGVNQTYAYIASSNNIGELIILNVTNPGSIPNPSGSAVTGSTLNLPGTNASNENLDATSIFLIGNRAYIGRERASGSSKDFYIVDISDPGTPTILGSTNLALASGTEVTGIHASLNLAFVATSDPNKPFIVLDVTNPSAITRFDIAGCIMNFSTFPTGIDYDNNLIYLPLYNSSSNINLKIIKPTGGSC